MLLKIYGSVFTFRYGPVAVAGPSGWLKITPKALLVSPFLMSKLRLSHPKTPPIGGVRNEIEYSSQSAISAPRKVLVILNAW
jgi:hypothetical protein